MTRALLPGRQTSKTRRLEPQLSFGRWEPHFEDSDMFGKLRWTIGARWCGLTHESLMWPVHGHYECRKCGRRYPAFAETPIANWTKRAAWKPAVSLMLAMTLATFVRPVQAADALKGYAAAEAE